MNQASVFVTTSFSGFHRWHDAPDCVRFLHDWHRHMFHVRLEVTVGGLDREIEFLQLKNRVDDYIASRWKDESFEASCEMIAAELLQQFSAAWVEVSEDGENGAVVRRVVKSSAWRKCFVGIEAEGPNRGAVVLFVPGSVPWQRIELLVSKVADLPLERVYYGAACDYNFLPGTLEWLGLFCRKAELQLEVETDHRSEELAQHRSLVSNLVTVGSLAGSGFGDYMKVVVGSLIVWTSTKTGKQYTTSVCDPLFAGDFVVED